MSIQFPITQFYGAGGLFNIFLPPFSVEVVTLQSVTFTRKAYDVYIPNFSRWDNPVTLSSYGDGEEAGFFSGWLVYRIAVQTNSEVSTRAGWEKFAVEKLTIHTLA